MTIDGLTKLQRMVPHPRIIRKQKEYLIGRERRRTRGKVREEKRRRGGREHEFAWVRRRWEEIRQKMKGLDVIKYIFQIIDN